MLNIVTFSRLLTCREKHFFKVSETSESSKEKPSTPSNTLLDLSTHDFYILWKPPTNLQQPPSEPPPRPPKDPRTNHKEPPSEPPPRPPKASQKVPNTSSNPPKKPKGM